MMHVAKAAAAARPPQRKSRVARSNRLRAAIAAIGVALSGGAVAAQVMYVSRDGTDSGCLLSSSTPCATLGRALSLLPSGGTVVVLDMVRFNSGPLIITRGVSIVGPGPEVPIMAGDPAKSLGAGILVAAPAGELVELSRFRIEGFGTATWGVRVRSAGEVHISDCFIRNVRGSRAAIEVDSTTATRVFVSDCTITQNHNGVIVDPLAPATATVFLDSVVVDKNAGAGIQARAGATVRLNNSTVTNNFVGLQALKDGRLISFGNNAVAGNTTDGFPTETIDLR